ncbi:MAG: alpha/beta hydrolase, partial [Pseudomonadota bacterium]|nr:alpha/beta hydrolase [Pseudomonadota bacterium]
GDRQKWEDALHETFCARNFRDIHPREFEATATTIWNAPIPRGAKWDMRVSPSLSYWGTCDEPVLLLYGTEDKNGTRENAEDLHDRLSDSRLHYIDDTGHFVVREAPDTVVDLICEFISELSVQKPAS